jgi:hypothetical protein
MSDEASKCTCKTDRKPLACTKKYGVIYSNCEHCKEIELRRVMDSRPRFTIGGK